MNADPMSAAPSTEAILWDNDGVLVDTEHLYFRATQQVLATAGIGLTEAEYIELFLVQGRGAWHIAEERGIGGVEIDRLRHARNLLYAEWLGQGAWLIDGITAVLAALHGKYVMGVVTSSRRDHFDLIHSTTGLLRYFDFVLTADDVTRVKPDPELYVSAVARTGLARERCVAVEDSGRGLAAARGAGVRCIVVPTSLTRGGTFAGADCVLDTLSHLPHVL
jgi:HAD superfamily hydrolase (TIGR01509 family)